MNKSLEQSVPKIKLSKNKKKGGKIWWNQKCTNIAKERKITFMIYKNNPTQLNLINYKKIDSLTKKILKEEKTGEITAHP